MLIFWVRITKVAPPPLTTLFCFKKAKNKSECFIFGRYSDCIDKIKIWELSIEMILLTHSWKRIVHLIHKLNIYKRIVNNSDDSNSYHYTDLFFGTIDILKFLNFFQWIYVRFENTNLLSEIRNHLATHIHCLVKKGTMHEWDHVKLSLAPSSCECNIFKDNLPPIFCHLKPATYFIWKINFERQWIAGFGLYRAVPLLFFYTTE